MNPFLPSPHGHPNFNPIKNVSNKNSQPELSRNSKQPKPPDKPMMPYMRYSKKVWDDVRAQFSDLKVYEVSKIVGQMWRDLSDSEKQKYVEEFEIEKNEYNELLKQYHNSPAYQAWIQASHKTKDNEEREGGPKRKEKKANNSSVHNSPQKSESRYSLQPMEIDENEEYFSVKHLAAARYYRNNKLVNEIFSETIVPDMRSTPDLKIQLLRKQVDSLTVYQKKLDDELVQIEEKFQQKKQALIESSERFQNEMNKRFSQNDLDTMLKDHYRKTLAKTIETLKGDQSSSLCQSSKMIINHQHDSNNVNNQSNHSSNQKQNHITNNNHNSQDIPLNGIKDNSNSNSSSQI